MLCKLRNFTPVLLGCLASIAGAYDYNGTPAGHLIYIHTTSQIQQYIADGWRPTSVSLETSVGAIGFYRVTYVQNTGSHYKEVRFDGERTSAQITTIRNSGWRIEDVEVVGSKYSGIFIRNVTNPESTLWFAGWTASSIGTWLGANPTWRPLELDRYGTGSSERFSGIFIKNTGTAAVGGWGWYPDASSTTIKNWASANNMRLVDLDRGTTGGYAAVMVSRNPGERYYWFAGKSGSTILAQLGALGLRAVTMDKSTYGGSTSYSVTAVNNTNSQSARIADMTWPNHNGIQGFYVRQMGSFSVPVNLNGDRTMHPSSTIKALIHYVGALDTTTDQLNTRVISGQTMVSRHQDMMYNSDNTDANTLMDAYTIARLESVAHNDLGMSDVTQLRNRFGTGGPYDNDEITETTLADLGLLHTAIRDGRLGATKTAWLRTNMNNETRSWPWSSVVANIRSELGISTTNYNDWLSRVRALNKAGSNSDNGVTGYWSVSGTLTLPYKSKTLTVLRTYLFGHYVNGSSVNYSAGWTITGELLREQIRASMLTYD